MKRKLCIGVLYLLMCIAVTSIVVCSVYLYWNFEVAIVRNINSQSSIDVKCDKIFNGTVLEILEKSNTVLIELSDNTNLVIGMDLDNKKLEIGQHVKLYRNCIYQCLLRVAIYINNNDEYYWKPPYSSNECLSGEFAHGLLVFTGVIFTFGMYILGILLSLLMLMIILLKLYVYPRLRSKVNEYKQSHKYVKVSDNQYL